MKGSIPLDNRPWKEAKPIKGFRYFIELFRDKEKESNEESKK